MEITSNTENQELSPEMQTILNDPRMQQRARQMATRYVYSPIIDCVVAGSIPGGWIPKGRIYPISVQIRHNIQRDEKQNDDPTYVVEEIYPDEIMASVLNRYAAQGAIE